MVIWILSDVILNIQEAGKPAAKAAKVESRSEEDEDDSSEESSDEEPKKVPEKKVVNEANYSH